MGNLAAARVRLQTVATLEQPLAIAVRPGDPALYVAEKVGRVVAVTRGAEPRTLLDLTGQVSLGSEQGLLGLAFSPDGKYLYVDFTDVNGDTRVSEFRFGDRGADPGSRRVGSPCCDCSVGSPIGAPGRSPPSYRGNATEGENLPGHPPLAALRV